MPTDNSDPRPFAGFDRAFVREHIRSSVGRFVEVFPADGERFLTVPTVEHGEPVEGPGRVFSPETQAVVDSLFAAVGRLKHPYPDGAGRGYFLERVVGSDRSSVADSKGTTPSPDA